MIDYASLEDLFIQFGYRWYFDGVLKNPTAEDLRQAIDRLGKELYDDGQQAELGHLIVQRNGRHLDVYLHVGEQGGPG